MAFNPDAYLASKKTGGFDPDAYLVSKGQADQSTFDKINNSFPGVRRGLETGLDALNAPFELAGEATTMAMGGGQWQAPSILQKNPSLLGAANSLLPKSAEFATGQQPVAAYTLPRRILKGVAGAASNPANPRRAGTEAFFSDQPLDIGTDLGFSFVAPQAMTAPMTATTKAASLLKNNVAKPIFSGAKSMAGSAIEGSKPFARKTLSSIFGVSDEAAQARINRPNDLKNAVPYTDLSDDMAKTMGTLEEQIEKMDDEAWGSLLKLKAEPRSEVVDILKGIRREIKVTGGGAIGSADKKALATIDDLINGVQSIKQKGIDPSLEQMLDQRQLREILQAARRNVNFQDPSASRTNEALNEFQARLSARLKADNPQYEKIMEPLAEKTRLLNEMKRSFSIKKEDGVFTPQNTTADKFPQALAEKRVGTRRILSDLKEQTGKDYLKQAQDYAYAKQFEPGRTKSEGSKRVNLGGFVGSAIGAIFGGWGGAAAGSVAGGVAGAHLDRQGGAMFAKLIDSYLKVKKSSPSLTFKEFLPLAEPELKKIGLDMHSFLPAVEEMSDEIPAGGRPLFKANKGILPVMTETVHDDSVIPFTPKKLLKPKMLDKKKAVQYLDKANDDIEMARQMAKDDGYEWA